jgi:hypothetical protein
MVLTVGIMLPLEGEAAARRVRRAAVSQKKVATPPMFARGEGTQQSPYVILTATQLSGFAASVNSGNAYSGKFVKLGADIDLRNMFWVPIGIYRDGVATRPFKGFFDGAGFTIFNMGTGNNVRPTTALFGALDGATIGGVNLQAIEVDGDSNIGGLAAYMARTVLKNCSISGNVRGRSAVGGIVGSSYKGFIENCSFFGSVTGESGVGGVVGAMDQSRMRLCRVVGRVEGKTDVGGFVGGALEGFLITDCFAESLTVQGERNVGGFIGNLIDKGDVSRSAFKGQVMGDSSAGGVAGRMTAGNVSACSVAGSVNGKTRLGGIAGELVDGEIRNCVSSASIDGVADLGGVVGKMSGGKLNGNANHGVVAGGGAVGGVVGNFSGGEMNLSSHKSTGSVKGYILADSLVGIQAR